MGREKTSATAAPAWPLLSEYINALLGQVGVSHCPLCQLKRNHVSELLPPTGENTTGLNGGSQLHPGLLTAVRGLLFRIQGPAIPSGELGWNSRTFDL